MSNGIIPVEQIARRIVFLRGEKVMLGQDLAKLYGVTVSALIQAVKRNADRFPEDFMYSLTSEEFVHLKSQFVISSWGGLRKRPYAFTEQGIAMLSSVLTSDRAIKVNIAIMRAFVKLRRALETNRELARKFAELEARVDKHDEEISEIMEAIRQLMSPSEEPRREIGFHVREKAPRYRVRKRT